MYSTFATEKNLEIIYNVLQKKFYRHDKSLEQLKTEFLESHNGFFVLLLQYSTWKFYDGNFNTVELSQEDFIEYVLTGSVASTLITSLKAGDKFTVNGYDGTVFRYINLIIDSKAYGINSEYQAKSFNLDTTVTRVN